MRRILSIDPGTNVLGYCEWHVDDEARRGKYVRSGVVRAVRGRCEWYTRAMSIANDLAARVRVASRPMDLVVCEMPQVFGGGNGGMGRGAAANASGDVLKIAAVAGMTLGAVLSREQMLVPVSKWKGNVPKAITKQRIERAWGIDGRLLETLDESDAIGIGDWYIRKHLGYQSTRAQR